MVSVAPTLPCRRYAYNQSTIIIGTNSFDEKLSRGAVSDLGKENPAKGIVTKTGERETVDRIASGHGPALLSPSPLCAADYPARDLALSSLHPELPRRGGSPCRAWARCFL